MKNWLLEAMRILWMCIKSSFESAYCIHKISRLTSPIITVFGGKNTLKEGEYAKNAHDIAAQCVANGFSVLTGGGPGSMEAANCGALSQAQKNNTPLPVTLGIGIRGVDVQFTNSCAQVIYLSQFFMRKWFLMRYSAGIIVMPGGIGTAEELFEILDLLKTKKINPVPVILFDSNYWQPLINWFEHSGMKNGFIKPEHRHLFTVTDDIKKVISAIKHTQ